MRIFFKGLKFYISTLLVGAALLLATGCSMTADNTIGYDIVPESQKMELRHLKFRGNNVVTIDENGYVQTSPLVGKNLVETRQYRTDSLLSSKMKVGYMGVRRSDIYGLRSAGFASSMVYMNLINDKEGFGYRPIFDTLFLLLSINNYGGDTLVPINYKVYEVVKPLVGNVLSEKDSTAYINCDLSPVYDKSKPLFTFTFPDKSKGEGPATGYLALTPVAGGFNGLSEQTWDYVRRLMLIPEDTDDWDGYATSGIGCYQNEDVWAERFHGLYIEPDITTSATDNEGAMYALDLSASGLMLKGRGRHPQDPTLIRDTVGMYYYFYNKDVKHNLSVNTIHRDLTQSESGGAALLNSVEMSCEKSIEERDLRAKCYIEGMGGPSMELTFTDDFLDQLLALYDDNVENFQHIGINQCMLTFYVDGASYDWNETQSNAAVLTPILNDSFTALGTYLNYNRWTPVIDYDYLYQQNYNADLAYSGKLDRTRGCYMMNLSAYMQRLFNYVKRVRQEDGTYLFNKSDSDYMSRTIYLGAEALAPFALSATVLQGMENDGTTTTQAPVQIDLTYTLLKK
ncbi:MAG: DUF4270 family protein [Alistipes sp.]|nr:DUF4270 family protein [Alistipes sp.]